jgi:hypothetical protein
LCYAIGVLFVFTSLFFGVAPDGGSFMHPPLTGVTYSLAVKTDIAQHLNLATRDAVHVVSRDRSCVRWRRIWSR